MANPLAFRLVEAKPEAACLLTYCREMARESPAHPTPSPVLELTRVCGPVLSTFQNWQDSLDPAFPNRHAIGHGRYDPSLFTEETSIKVFLLLDAVKQLIAAQNQDEQVGAGGAS